jgi:fructose-1,6-bisphosphatase
MQLITGGFSVAFDPLDGSSIVDTNFTVGTIFGVFLGEKLIGVTGRDQVAAAMGVLGPRTTYVLALLLKISLVLMNFSFLMKVRLIFDAIRFIFCDMFILTWNFSITL